MKFIKVVIIDWYDNILNAFCIDENDLTYYCCVLAINQITNEKIYLAVDLKYLTGQSELLEIIKLDSFREKWSDLPGLIDLKKENETYLIRSKDLLKMDDVHQIKFRVNFKCAKYMIPGNFQNLWDKGEKINDWLVYKEMVEYLNLP